MKTRKTNKKPSPLAEFFVSKSKTSKLQELRIRDDVGGRRTQVEYGTYHSDGIHRADVEDKTFLFEAKQTDRKSFALSQKILVKLDGEALSGGKIPAVVIQFRKFPHSVEREWAVIPYSYLKKMLNQLRGDKNA